MLLADTGVLFGATDRDDPRHSDCADVLDDHARELLVPVPVIVESSWLIESRLGSAVEAERPTSPISPQRGVPSTELPETGVFEDQHWEGTAPAWADRPPAPEVGHGIDLGL